METLAVIIILLLSASALIHPETLKYVKQYNLMTPIERRLYNALLKHGLKPIPQYSILGYRLDFALFSNDIKLDVECDGKDYHSKPWQKTHDKKRTQMLNRHGWKVIRFTGSQINKNPDRCVQSIKKKLRVY